MKYWNGERKSLPVPEKESWKCNYCVFFGKECKAWWSAKGALMPSKEQLRIQFSKEPSKYYAVELFKKEGFERGKCMRCGKYFWTADCGKEAVRRPVPRAVLLHEAEAEGASPIRASGSKFSKFFKKEGHAIVDSYPVVSRWRQDLYSR